MPKIVMKGKMSKLKIITSSKAPRAIGPYSQAMLPADSGTPLWISGQIGIDPQSGKIISTEAGKQTRQVMENIRAILAEVELTLDDVVSVTVYLTDMSDYDEVNRVYKEEFGQHEPSRAAVEVSELPKNAKIEMVATAWKSDKQNK